MRKARWIIPLAVCLGLALASQAVLAKTDISDDYVKIGILTDMSGVYSAIGGSGAVLAARMAIKDAGGEVLGKPVKLVSADHQDKADVAATIARTWIDADHVDMIVGMNNSAVGLAVQSLASDKHVITINTGAGSTALTEQQCTRYGIHYTYDTHALSVGTASAVVDHGGDSWFFITADYAFGHSLQDNASKVIKRMGGTVVGSVQAPLNTTDYASYLLQAQSSGAEVIGLANTGQDAINAIKQAATFGITRHGQRLASLLIFLTDIKSIGLQTGQGLLTTTAFYWNRNDATRQWSERFFKAHGTMPTMVQASVYSAIHTYLEAVKKAGTDDSDAVRAQLGKMTINDFFVHGGHILVNGLMKHDMYLVKVKKPSQSEGPWDLLEVVDTIPADKAWIPLSQSKCRLVGKE